MHQCCWTKRLKTYLGKEGIEAKEGILRNREEWKAIYNIGKLKNRSGDTKGFGVFGNEKSLRWYRATCR